MIQGAGRVRARIAAALRPCPWAAVAAGAGRCEKSARRLCRSGHAAGDVRRRGASGYRQRRRPPCQSRQSRCQGAAHARCDDPRRSRCRSPPRCWRRHPRRLLRSAGALPRPLHRPRLGDARQRAHVEVDQPRPHVPDLRALDAPRKAVHAALRIDGHKIAPVAPRQNPAGILKRLGESSAGVRLPP